MAKVRPSLAPGRREHDRGAATDDASVATQGMLRARSEPTSTAG